MKYSCRMDFYSSVTVDLDESVKLSEHITMGEACNKSAKDAAPKMIWSRDVEDFFDALEEFRSILVDAGIMKWLEINCINRTADFNKACGGIANSSHLEALACDNSIKKGYAVVVSDPIRKIISSIWKYICKKHGRVGYICWYTGGFHLDFAATGSFKIYDYRKTNKDW